MRKIILLAAMMLALGCAIAGAQQEKYQADWASLDARPIPQWFDDAKFGIFIHWGVYSVPAWGAKGTYSEWYWSDLMRPGSRTREFHDKNYGPDFKYQDFAPMFKAEMYDPAAWADVFERSGAKYVVLTSKHHEGFALWPSRYSWNWNSWDIGPHKDLAGELSKAVRDKGLKMGFYYSLYEWYNPFFFKPEDPFEKYTKTKKQTDPMRSRNPEDIRNFVDNHMLPQMKELVNAYKPSLLWTDGEWDHTSDVWRSEEFLAWLYNDSPVKDDIVVNDRWGKETRMAHGGFYTSEYGGTGGGKKVGIERKWEECRGIGRSFGYNRNEDISDYETASALVHMLVNIVSNGGNLLLDIGPTADGRIPDVMQQRLLEMGEWLKVNGEAIYGSRPWRAMAEGDNVRYTSKGGAIYAISLKWPGKTLTLEAPKARAGAKVSLLGHKELLTWKPRKGGGIVIDVPQLSAADAPCMHAWTFKIEGAE